MSQESTEQNKLSKGEQPSPQPSGSNGDTLQGTNLDHLDTVTLHRAGKDKEVKWDQIRHPHAVSLGKPFQQNLLNRGQQQGTPTNSNSGNNNNSSGGLLQTAGHRPTPTGPDSH